MSKLSPSDDANAAPAKPHRPRPRQAPTVRGKSTRQAKQKRAGWNRLPTRLGRSQNETYHILIVCLRDIECWTNGLCVYSLNTFRTSRTRLYFLEEMASRGVVLSNTAVPEKKMHSLQQQSRHHHNVPSPAPTPHSSALFFFSPDYTSTAAVLFNQS